MNTNTLTVLATLPLPVQALFALKGQFVRMKSARLLKVRKGQAEIVKESEYTCRVGVDYDNIQSVKDGRADGSKPEENAGRPWGEWVLFPFIASHKGNYYFRCTSVRNNPMCVPSVRFLRDGVEITREEAQVAALASEFYEKENEVFEVKIESILDVNGKPL
jgi:hypothetical protein